MLFRHLHTIKRIFRFSVSDLFQKRPSWWGAADAGPFFLKEKNVWFHDRAIFCSTKYASGNPTLGAMPSPMADQICVESSDSNFPQLFLNYQVNSNFCLFVVNVLGSRCSLFSRFSLFDFPGLCFKVETDKILFTAKHHRLVFGLFWVYLQPVARRKRKKTFKNVSMYQKNEG